MTEIFIYGQSDDLIEIVGETHEELYAKYGEPTLVAISPGYIIEVEYDGEWKLDVLAKPYHGQCKHGEVGCYPDKCNNYTEVIEIDHPDEEYEIQKVDSIEEGEKIFQNNSKTEEIRDLLEEWEEEAEEFRERGGHGMCVEYVQANTIEEKIEEVRDHFWNS